MTFTSFQNEWWPFLFILIGGFVATDMWRWLGVLAGRRLRDDSAALGFVRAVATALVAAVIARLIVFPTGALAEVSLAVRLLASAAGFAVFLATGKKVYVGIAAAVLTLVAGAMIAG